MGDPDFYFQKISSKVIPASLSLLMSRSTGSCRPTIVKYFYQKISFFSIYILLYFIDTVSINLTIHDPIFFTRFSPPSKFR